MSHMIRINGRHNATNRLDGAASGFTVIEILTVITIISILAILAIVSYNVIVDRARETSVVSDATQGASLVKAQQYSNGTYPTNCASTGIKASSGNTLNCAVASDARSFCVNVSYQDKFSYYATNNILNPVKGVCSGSTGVAEAQVASMMGVGIGHACGLFGGRPYCWGGNWAGQLGNGTTVNSNTPVAVDTSGVLAGKTITDLTVGDYFSCVIANGAPYCWGWNSYGQLGNGLTTNSSVPVAVNMSGALAGKTVTKITGGYYNACAIADGAAYCWGTSGFDGLGSNTQYSYTPKAVDTSGVLAGKTVTDIDAENFGGVVCAVADGAPYCWGYGASGGMGNGTNTTSNWLPVAVDTSGVLAGKTVTDVSTYEYHACAVADGKPYCWGGNGSSQLGNGSTTSSNVPVAVDASGVLAGKTIVSVTAGDYATCSLDSQGAVFCWGDNMYGSLGNNTYTDSTVPVAVSTSGTMSGKTHSYLAMGYFTVCSVASGWGHCWGNSTYGPGELGVGPTPTSSSVPLPISGLPN